MKPVDTDIDIDVLDRSKVLEHLPHVNAMMKREDAPVKHNTGVYFQQIPRDPRENLATIDYKEAGQLGYVKIDLLNNSVYSGVKDEEHLVRLLNASPMWSILDEEQIVEKLFHIGQHADLVQQMKPRSVEELAMLLAVIRPAKSYLRGKSWDEVKLEVWEKPTDGSYAFKKSHAFGYALAIVVQMNLLVEQSVQLS